MKINIDFFYINFKGSNFNYFNMSNGVIPFMCYL